MERFTLPGYEILSKIGEGGMATVWKARQVSLNRLVAIKVLSKDSGPSGSAAVDRFHVEAQAAAKLQHPGIVLVYDAGEQEGLAYLVMEYIDGYSVGDLLERHRRIPEKDALAVAESVARALGHAWETQRIIHCDIKPDNIMIAGDGTVKMADLGLARILGVRTRGDDSDLVLGTPNYMSPEQVEGAAELDCRADIYSLGATLYHLVTGQLPFAGSPEDEIMERHITDQIPDAQEISPELSAGMTWLLEKMMVKDRNKRPATWESVIADIADVSAGGMPRPPLPAPGASTMRRSGKRSAAEQARTQRVSKADEMADTPAVARRRLVVSKGAMDRIQAGNSDAVFDLGAAVRSLLVMATLTVAVYGITLWMVHHPKPEQNQVSAPMSFPVHVEEASPRPEWKEYKPPATSAGSSAIAEAVHTRWQNADFAEGARRFNRALAAYKEYETTRKDRSVLSVIEEDCREAIRRFESCRDAAPPEVNMSQYIAQCNGLIFDVRQQMVVSPAK